MKKIFLLLLPALLHADGDKEKLPSWLLPKPPAKEATTDMTADVSAEALADEAIAHVNDSNAIQFLARLHDRAEALGQARLIYGVLENLGNSENTAAAKAKLDHEVGLATIMVITGKAVIKRSSKWRFVLNAPGEGDEPEQESDEIREMKHILEMLPENHPCRRSLDLQIRIEEYVARAVRVIKLQRATLDPLE